MRRSRKRPGRKRVGRVSYYLHHGGWHLYYQESGESVRKRVADTEEAAARLAAQVNAQLSSGAQTLFSFEPVTVPELRQRFLDHHEHVLNSSLGTVRRYRAATRHLENFAAANGKPTSAHLIAADRYVCYLRTLKVAPNGHANTRKRLLRGKGIRYILEVCRSMYAFAAKKRHLPPYAENPFAELALERMKVEDAKPIFLFDEETELAFFQAAADWSFPVHFTLAKTGLRSGELRHLLIEEVDLESGWLRVRNKPELGWRIKTGRERPVPLVDDLVHVLRRVIGERTNGLVFLRQLFRAEESDLAAADYDTLVTVCRSRLDRAESDQGRPSSREEQAAVCRGVWRDAGAVRAEAIRKSFIRSTQAIGLPQATCPKSWRHTFATLLQDANVDPLIRQLTLGHKPTNDARSALGMTACYSHSRMVTRKREIERALRLWPGVLEFACHWAHRGM
jgi:integrase